MRLNGMRITFHRLALAAVMAFTGASCTTAYDYYGRPRTVVEPGAALIGVAAAGLLGYALADGGGGGRRHHGHHRGHGRHYY
jgi:hypothetical protein